MLSDKNDLVVDPFAGSCVTGEVCERLKRKWLCIELRKDYLETAIGRFQNPTKRGTEVQRGETKASYYRIPHPGILFESCKDNHLVTDGGKTRPLALVKTQKTQGRKSSVPNSVFNNVILSVRWAIDNISSGFIVLRAGLNPNYGTTGTFDRKTAVAL